MSSFSVMSIIQNDRKASAFPWVVLVIRNHISATAVVRQLLYLHCCQWLIFYYIHYSGFSIYNLKKIVSLPFKICWRYGLGTSQDLLKVLEMKILWSAKPRSNSFVKLGELWQDLSKDDPTLALRLWLWLAEQSGLNFTFTFRLKYSHLIIKMYICMVPTYLHFYFHH